MRKNIVPAQLWMESASIEFEATRSFKSGIENLTTGILVQPIEPSSVT